MTAVNVDLPQFEEPPEDSGAETGYLYIMRCPAMEADIYKVGWTAKSPTERAEELSSHTGVPLFFIVVESWSVTNPRAVEMLAKEALADFRLSPRREFFKASYEEIRSRIRSALALGA
jgi:hypothetical protein